jgi:hypothetical protein
MASQPPRRSGTILLASGPWLPRPTTTSPRSGMAGRWLSGSGEHRWTTQSSPRRWTALLHLEPGRRSGVRQHRCRNDRWADRSAVSTGSSRRRSHDPGADQAGESDRGAMRLNDCAKMAASLPSRRPCRRSGICRGRSRCLKDRARSRNGEVSHAPLRCNPNWCTLRGCPRRDRRPRRSRMSSISR